MHKIIFVIMDISSSTIKFACISNVELDSMIIVLRYPFINILNIESIVYACGDNCNTTTHVVIESSIFLPSSWRRGIKYFTKKTSHFQGDLEAYGNLYW
jgi:hypothetical protein